VGTIEERRAALEAEFSPWTSRTLDELFGRCVQKYSDRPLVVTDERTLTYGDVDVLAQELADGLVSSGVMPGDRVGVIMANHAEFVPIKLAIARAGAVMVPFNFLYRERELEYVLEQSRCSVLISMTSFTGLDYVAMLDAIFPSDWRAWSAANATSSPRHLKQVVLFPADAPAKDGATTLDDLAALGRRTPGASSATRRNPDEIGDILYTSGSTGAPKGVCLTHDAVLRTGYASALTRAFQDGRRVLFSLPCYHMFGLVEGFISILYVGGAIIPQRSFSAEGYFAGIERHRADDILCVPTMAVAMVESDASNYDLSSLGAILCGSAPAPVWLWEKIERDFGVSEIVTGYGMTEVGGATTMTLPEDPLILTSTTVGRLKMAGAASYRDTGALAEYRTVNPENHEPLAPGEIGELVSRGATTMSGFWDKPEETSAVLRDEWLHSGDLGRVREDGYFELTGRSKELYKSGGELVMPREIEDLLGRMQQISQVYAIGVVDDRWGEIGCAVVVRAPGQELTEEEVIAHCKANLARFKVPRRVIFLGPDDLPITPNGKVQKFKLVDLVPTN